MYFNSTFNIQSHDVAALEIWLWDLAFISCYLHDPTLYHFIQRAILMLLLRYANTS